MKETYHNDHIVMLYNVTVNGQTIAGYFDTKDQFLSALMLATNSYNRMSEMYVTFRTLLLYLYAAATSRETENMLKDFRHLVYLSPNKAKDTRTEITVTAYGLGGRPKNNYHKDGAESRIDNEKYESVTRPIQGYIRKLPDGQHASREAIDRAEALGFDLAENETYVQPFVKNILRLKENYLR